MKPGDRVKLSKLPVGSTGKFVSKGTENYMNLAGVGFIVTGRYCRNDAMDFTQVLTVMGSVLSFIWECDDPVVEFVGEPQVSKSEPADAQASNP